MYRKSVLTLFITLSIIINFSSKIQAQGTPPHPAGYWLAYFGDNKLSKKFGVHTELQWRNMFLDHSVQSILARTGVHLYLHPQVTATAGYGYIYVEPTSNDVIGAKVLENRIWEQLTFRNKTGKFSFEHRFRLEHRMLHNTTKSTHYQSQRLRYRFQSILPLQAITPGLEPFFAVFNNELFVNLKKEPSHIFDRNRMFLGLGFQANSKMNVQLGYMNQFAHITGNPKPQVDRIALLAITYNTNWTKE